MRLLSVGMILKTCEIQKTDERERHGGVSYHSFPPDKAERRGVATN